MTKFLLFCSHHRWLKGTAKPLNNKVFPPCCNARTVRSVDETRKVFGMAGRKGWTITGVDEQVRAEAVGAAERAGMPLHGVGRAGGARAPPARAGPRAAGRRGDRRARGDGAAGGGGGGGVPGGGAGGGPGGG